MVIDDDVAVICDQLSFLYSKATALEYEESVYQKIFRKYVKH